MSRHIVPEAEEILDRYFPIHDHGFVALVDYMGSDAAVIEAARTSYGRVKKKSDDRSLLRYLFRNRHTTPFEMVELKFHCKMPIFVARQWIRHRTANVNEMSGRYQMLPMQFYTPKREHTATQSTKNKQGRSANILDLKEYELFVADLKHHRDLVKTDYVDFAKNYEVAKELARIELPVSVYTQWYWKIDLHNLCHFLGLRCHSHAQFEVREYATRMASMVGRVAPLTFEAFLDYHPNMGGHLVSRQEIDLLRRLIQTHSNAGKRALYPMEEPLCDSEYDASGISKRELSVLLDLFDSNAAREIGSFELPISEARDGSYFEAEAARYTIHLD